MAPRPLGRRDLRGNQAGAAGGGARSHCVRQRLPPAGGWSAERRRDVRNCRDRGGGAMTPDLKLIDNSTGSDLELVARLAGALVDLTVRAPVANSVAFVRQMEGALAEADAVARSTSIPALAAEVSGLQR